MNASSHSLNASAGSLRPHGESESIFELQKILNDERSRATQHKINYQKIKSELTNIQEKYGQLEQEFISCSEARKNETDDYNRVCAQLNRRLKDTEKEIEELKVNQVTEKRIEIIRLKIEEEYEGVYQERLSNSKQELESIRQEIQTIRQENMFLKSELDHQAQEHRRVIEELNMIHDSEMKILKEEKIRLLANTMEIPSEPSGNIKELSKENGILKSQIKSMHNELKEAQVKIEQFKTNLDQESRLKTKQVSELTTVIKRMEIEENSLRKQLSEQQRESGNYSSELSTSRHKITELERTCRNLQNRIEELIQKAKVDLTQLKLESNKQRSDIERQRESQASKIDELEYQLQLAGNRCGILEKQLKDRDIEIARREAAIKEEEWSRIQKVEQEKLDAESKINELEIRLREERASVSSRMSKLEEKYEQSEKNCRSAEKELESLKQKLEHSSTELKKLKQNLMDTKSKNLQIEAELDECYNKLAISELSKEEKKEYEEKIEKMEKELREIKSEKEDAYQEKMEDWKRDRQRQQERIKELEEELASSLEKCRVLQDEIKRKNKKHGNYFQKQKQKLQISSAKLEKMSIENDMLKQNVPAEEYQKLRRELKELRRKHQEYSAIIAMQSDNYLRNNSGSRTNDEPNSNAAHQQMERSVDELRRRLQWLDEKQQQQLPEILDLQMRQDQNDTINNNKNTPPFEYGPQGDS